MTARALHAILWSCVLVTLAIVVGPGCGSVELTAPLVELDGGPSGVVDASPRLPVDDGHGVEIQDHAPARDGAPEEPSTCSTGAAAGCAACTQATSTGPGYPDVATCAAVVACVQGGDAGAYPLQSCHNLAGGGQAWGGLQCVQALLKACP